VSEKFDKAVMANVQRERMKGLATKTDCFRFRHGEWVTSKQTAAETVHSRTTCQRVYSALTNAELMEAKKVGKVYFFRAIKPIDTVLTLDMFNDDDYSQRVKVVQIDNGIGAPIADHSWRPPLVRSWGGYRVAA
jgi:hypothetical protein